MSPAISTSGIKTNAREDILGCGRISRFVRKTISPKRSKSKSISRAAFFFFAHASELPLNFKQRIRQRIRRQSRPQLDDGVNVIRLRFANAHRRRQIKRRNRANARARNFAEPNRRRFHLRLRTAEIRPESDKSRRRHSSGLFLRARTPPPAVGRFFRQQREQFFSRFGGLAFGFFQGIPPFCRAGFEGGIAAAFFRN